MKGLHKKIIVGSLVGCLSIGAGLSQASIAYSLSSGVKRSANYSLHNYESLAYRYLQLAGKHFGFIISYYQSNYYAPVSSDKNFENPGIFIQSLYDNGIKKGHHGFQIGNEYYVLIFRKDFKSVPQWKQWEEDGDGFPSFFSFKG